jgi:hypothetical protein
MAFVIRSEKKPNFTKSETGPIGPGDYYPEVIHSIGNKSINKSNSSDNNNNNNQHEQNFTAFNSSSIRDFDMSCKHSNPNVGPGSYINKTHSDPFMKQPPYTIGLTRSSSHLSLGTASSSLNNSNSNEYKVNMAMLNLLKKKQEQMLEDAKMLKVNNSSPKNNNNTNTVNARKKEKKLIAIIPGANKRISSIPSKYSYGYEMDFDGMLKQIEDPDKEIKYSGNKNDSVSPDYYYKTKQQRKNGLEWKRMSSKDLMGNKNETKASSSSSHNKRLSSSLLEGLHDSSATEADSGVINITVFGSASIDNNNNNNSNNVNQHRRDSTESSFKPETNIFKVRQKKSNYVGAEPRYNNGLCGDNISNNVNTNNTNYTAMSESQYNARSKTIEKLVYNNLFNVAPGPGYYFSEDEPNSIYKQKHFSNKQCFGSCAKRDCKLSTKPNNTLVGPGSYFETSKATDDKTEESKLRKFPFYKRENINYLLLNKKEKTNPYLGPGTYSFKSQFDKEKCLYSGPCQKRFNYTIRDDNKVPGPGEYIPLHEWCKQEDKLLQYIPEEHKPIKKNEYTTPGVGSYNPGIASSISYNILSKENKIQSVIAPFNSAIERGDGFLRSKSTSTLLGPGCYNSAKSDFDIPKNNTKIEQTKPLKSCMHYKEEAQKKVGPGSYGVYNYNNWNKKSFNVLFA